ncbi:hypothetical protein K435DRAFT_650590 [Dendrothele bispora CBS 962.96]|uniref:Sc15 protein n=1 Tax=Dendrothele bispora (strain CBS 962.96) TaxID=1314807 RepID=A0A4S8MLN7_DENBC|nr:hypothetical protein K435DRAFT_650590 [Dendrothele bispora CBS 962.96]
MFSRAFSFIAFLTLFLSFSFVASNPVTIPQAGSNAIKRQSNADIESVLNDLQDQVGTILPQIDALVSGGNATDDTVTPLITQLTDALNATTASLADLNTSSTSTKRQSNDDIANLVAGIVTDIANSLNGLLGSADSIPALGTLLSGVDFSLNQVLVGLETLLAGVLNLVATLLVDVAALLRSLAFGLTLASLGL